MRIIMELSKDIKSELTDAEHYTQRAVEVKAEYPEISKMYADLANKELSDAMSIHKWAVSEIDKSRATTTPPEYMLMIWNEEHKELLDRTARVKSQLDMLK